MSPAHVLEIEVIEAVPPDIQKGVSETVQALINGATITAITCQGEMQNANKLLQETKAKIKTIIERRKSLTAGHEQAIDAINDYFRPIVDLDRKNPKGQLDVLVAKLEAPMIAFTQAEEARRIEAQRKLDEEKRKKDEADAAAARKKQELEEAQRREAERKRQEAEAAQRRAEQAKRDQEAAEKRAAEAKNKAARDKAEREAREAKEKAEAEEAARKKAEQGAVRADNKADAAATAADNILELRNTRVTETVQSQAKVKGFSLTTTYIPVVEDESAFKEWCMKNDKYHYLEINMKILKAMVKADKLFKADGITVVPDVGSRSRG